MSKTNRTVGHHVRVFLRHPGDYGVCRIGGIHRTMEESQRDAEKVALAIEGNVSKYGDGRGDVEVVAETEPVCSHCGDKWTEHNDQYNGCCTADEAGLEDLPIERLDALVAEYRRRAESAETELEYYESLVREEKARRTAIQIQNAIVGLVAGG